MDYGYVHSFVACRSTTAETTAAAAAHLAVTTYMFFFLIFVLVNFLRLLYNNIHHHVNRRRKLHIYSSAEVPVLRTQSPVEVKGLAWHVVLYMGKTNEGMYIYRPSCRSLSLMLSSLTVSFSCCVVYSRGNRTPESEKKQTSVYLIKPKMKKKKLYTYQVRIYPGRHVGRFPWCCPYQVRIYPGHHVGRFPWCCRLWRFHLVV